MFSLSNPKLFLETIQHLYGEQPKSQFLQLFFLLANLLLLTFK